MIKFYYNEPTIGINNPIENLEKYIVQWANSNKYNRTIYDKIPKSKKNHPVMDQYKEVIDLFPDSKNIFEQSFNSVKQRGFWRI